MVCKPFPKKRLNEGLQFTVDSFLHRSYNQMPLGKAQAVLPQGCWFIMSQLGSRTNVHRAPVKCRALEEALGIQLWTGSQGASSERIHWDGNPPPELWDKLNGASVNVSPRDAHQPLSHEFFILSSWSGVRLSILQCSVIISAGRLSEWYIFWAHVFLILYHFYSIDDRAVTNLLESQPIHF